MNPESVPGAPMLPHFDRPNLPVPGRRPADTSGESGHGVGGERRNDAAASFGDTIARAQRDAEQQSDEHTSARAHSRGGPDRRANDGDDVVRDAAKPRRTGRAASREVVPTRADAQPRTSSPEPDDTAEAATAADSRPDALLAEAQGAELELPPAAAPEQLVTAQAAPAVMAPAAPPEGAPVTAITGQSDPAATGADPAGHAPPLAATLASHDAFAAPPAATAEYSVRADTRSTPVTAPGTAANRSDPSAALADIGRQSAGDDAPAVATRALQDAFAALTAAAVETTSDAPATAGAPAGETGATDVFLQQAAVATTRLASGDAITGPAQPGAGTPVGTLTAAGTHTQPASAHVAQPAIASMLTPLTHPAFTSHFAAEVASLAFRGIETAEIVLNPQELGPVRIELSLSGETARIAFTAAQPQTRHAIEQTLPVLEGMLADHGLLLSGSSVSDGHAGHGADGKAGSHHGDAAPSRETRMHASSAGFAGRAAVPRGLLDLYA